MVHTIETPKFERAYYAASIGEFLATTPAQVLGSLTAASEFSVDLTQRDAWLKEVEVLHALLPM